MSCLLVCPSAQPQRGVKQEVALCLPLFYEHGSHCSGGEMVLIESREVEIGEYVHVVHQEWRIALEPLSCFEDTAAGVEQLVPVISLNPALFMRVITRSSRVCPATSMSALGVLSVSGCKRVPSPAANIIAFIRL